METKTIKFQLEDSVSRDVIDLELYERVSVRTLKRIISDTHPNHPDIARIHMDYSDDDVLPAEVNETIVPLLYSYYHQEAKSVFVTYSILPETQVEEMVNLFGISDRQGGNEVPKRKGIVGNQSQGHLQLLRMFRSKEERRRAMLNEEGEHVVIEIPVVEMSPGTHLQTTQNIIYAIVSYYVIFHTKYDTNLMNSMKDHVVRKRLFDDSQGFSIPKTIIFVLFNL